MSFTLLGFMVTISRAPAMEPAYHPRQKTAQELRDEAWLKAMHYVAIGDLRTFF